MVIRAPSPGSLMSPSPFDGPVGAPCPADGNCGRLRVTSSAASGARSAEDLKFALFSILDAAKARPPSGEMLGLSSVANIELDEVLRGRQSRRIAGDGDGSDVIGGIQHGLTARG